MKLLGTILLYLSLSFVAFAQTQPFQLREVLVNTTTEHTWAPCFGYLLLDSTSHGELIIEEINSQNREFRVKYIPDSNFLGKDTIIIRYLETFSNIAVGRFISFTFNTVASQLIPKEDYVLVQKNSSANLILPLANDSTSSGVVFLNAVPSVNNGTIIVQSDSILFTPHADFEGLAKMSYRVCDNQDRCANGTIVVNVVDSSNIPSIDTMLLSTSENISIPVVLPSEGGWIIDDAPNKGSLVPLSPNSYLYKPQLYTSGNDLFSFVKGNIHRVVKMKIFNLPNPMSYVQGDIAFTAKNHAITINVVSNDVVKTYPILLHQNSPSSHGSAKVNPDKSFTFTPAQDYQGYTSFVYKSCNKGICEYATVGIYVGNYAPINTSLYYIKTHGRYSWQNTGISLNYNIPIGNYDIKIIKQPTPSTLLFYPGVQTVNFDCDTLIGYNQLVAIPGQNFSGQTAKGTIEFCIAGTTDCRRADIQFEIGPRSNDCKCVADCVWPGDVDFNGVVNMHDLLQLSYQMGKTGEDRNTNDAEFKALYADNWNDFLPASSIDIKHADNNGDGVLDVQDTTSISNFYYKVHSITPEPVYRRGDFPVYFELLNDTVDIGEIAFVEVSLGDQIDPATNVSGFTYNLDYNTDVVDEQSLTIDFYNDSWFTYNGSTVDMFKKPWVGRLESGFARVGGVKASGVGGVEILSFIVEDDIGGIRKDHPIVPVELYFSGMKGTDAEGNVISFPDQKKVMYIKTNSITEPKLDPNKLIVYPNPATTGINLVLNGLNNMEHIEIYSLSGVKIFESKAINLQKNKLDLSELQNGLYVLKVQTTLGPITKKFQLLR